MPPSGYFTFRKIRGITEVRVADDHALRQEAIAAFSSVAPLLSESAKSAVPTFDELKGAPPLREFIDSQENAGKTYHFILQVLGKEGEIVEKAVLLVNEMQQVCAVSRWRPDEGITFGRMN
ncbi:MAG: hypothetical protein AB1324_01075 [Candidatus Micrarchaeota archaeon]